MRNSRELIIDNHIARLLIHDRTGDLIAFGSLNYIRMEVLSIAILT